MRTRGGFTIVEALVALVMLNVGLLGLATTAGVVTRMIRHGRIATHAAALAGMRLELLRAEGCGAGSGSETRDGVMLDWDVGAPAVPNARIVQVRVRSAEPRGPRDSLTAVLFCP